MSLDDLLDASAYARRHIGPDADDERAMLDALGLRSVDELIEQALPAAIRQRTPLALPAPRGEAEALAELRALAATNQVWRTYIGMGYCGTRTPAVIQRNVLENPGWYTPYTPYQAEISQGRLEALAAFQQVVMDLTGLPVANASLLDEATAAAEAMGLIQRATRGAGKSFFIDEACHPQVIAVMRTRARWLGIPVIVADTTVLDQQRVFGAHLQYPDTFGRVIDPAPVIARVHASGGRVSLGVDPLALVLLKSPGALGADVAVGSAQRFGVPLGYGGPHPGFLAAKADLVRQMPGRIVGVTLDAAGRTAFRMALQTREQHIRRERATSNICTSQVLLANVAAFYAMWHGPEGLCRIALRAHFMARLLAHAAALDTSTGYFDTLVFRCDAAAARARAEAKRMNLRYLDDERVGVTVDETTTLADVADLAEVLGFGAFDATARAARLSTDAIAFPAALRREDAILVHPLFHDHRSESAMMRYLKRLENRDYSLTHGMIPLGSCTMKLNAAAAMAPISWAEFANPHPFAPRAQVAGTHRMLADVAAALEAITGLPHMTLQPNSGANGEFAGLVTIRNYHAARGESRRDVCLIPSSAHGTNPASAHMAGLQVAVVACDAHGNVDVADLAAKLAQFQDRVAALMLTYPSTHGVFEESVREICDRVHVAGGQVYLDGANLNALAGLARVAEFGADVCHINLHKTFCIPHGGGGPGMGPIAVAPHLAPYLPAHPVVPEPGLDAANGTVSAAPWGSALIVAISWMYLRMMGAPGIRRATEAAILSANYVAARLKNRWPVLYTGTRGRCAHECIFDLRALKERYGVTAEDIAKRLIDYGFHAPTLSFPVHETLMFEPTESEPKAELDRFCEAMIAIHGELENIASGAWPREDNPIRNAPHTAEELAQEWRHPYNRTEAVYPLPTVRNHKYWPPVKRVNQEFGDRHFFCGCPPPAEWAKEHPGGD